MTEKVILGFYNVFSVVIYCSVLILIISIPVLFATQANAPLDFRLEETSVRIADENDTYLTSNGISPEGWYRIDYVMSVAAGKISPYSYTVEGFTVKEPSYFKYSGNYAVFIDEPLSFSNTCRDDFILTLFVRGFENEDVVREFSKTVAFGTKGIDRSFSFFKERIMMYVPGFYVSDLL